MTCKTIHNWLEWMSMEGLLKDKCAHIMSLYTNQKSILPIATHKYTFNG